MKNFRVFIERDNSWHYFGTFKAKNTEMALELARSSKHELLGTYSFEEEEIPYINMEAEELPF
ncbi:hypothetical protein [Paenibacillus sp. FSL L8-0708]|uniref:hypothetical protein n=1 Tax=Paenibacillus sp. FSL L8-0708 TaxID=2975311 RepID=UPI0030F91576